MKDGPAIPPDRRHELRDTAFVALGMASHYAALAKQFLEVDDDKGAEYAIRQFVMHGRIAAARFREVMEANKQARIDAHLAEIESEAK